MLRGSSVKAGGGRECWDSCTSTSGWGLLQVSSMRDQIDLLATVTLLGVLEQGKCHLYNASIKLMMLSIVGCGSCSFLRVWNESLFSNMAK